MPKYILFDTETTGTSEEDRIIQIGAIIVHNKKNIEVYNSLCNTDKVIKLEAMEIHNITPNMIANQPSYGELDISHKLLEYNDKENYLIAHNINFDLGMLEKEGFENSYTLIDTLRCTKHLLPDLPYYRLQYLRYGLKLNELEEEEAVKMNIIIKAHDAIGDVLVMKLLLSRLVKITQEKFPTKNPMQHLALLTQTPVLIKIFKFGKHKDKEIADVVKSDKGYISWMQKNMDLDEDMRFTLEHYTKH
jgi:DNA polymerase III epsilon subunit-like protein